MKEKSKNKEDLNLPYRNTEQIEYPIQKDTPSIAEQEEPIMLFEELIARIVRVKPTVQAKLVKGRKKS